MNKKRFQLLSLTSLYLAIKLDGKSYLSIESMSKLGRGVEKSLIAQMELDLLFQLDWRVHPPTSVAFLKSYMLLLHREGESYQADILDLANFYVELAVLDYQFVRHRPSNIAMAALLNAIQDKLPTEFSHYRSVEHRDGTKTSKVAPVKKSIYSLNQVNVHSKHQI